MILIWFDKFLMLQGKMVNECYW